MVDAHFRSAKSFAHFFCCGVPSSQSVYANDGPDAYIHTGAFAPSTSSAKDHHISRGAGVPPSSAGSSSR
jgi:hypothetical protein